jgi:hypothetical protein
MIKHIKKLEERFGRERLLMGSLVILAVVIALWVCEFNSTPQNGESQELGVMIPAGQLVVPIELANANALANLVAKMAVVDLFTAGQVKPLVEGLRILKLSGGDGPLFGALVPQKMAGYLQDAFSKPKLRAAIKASSSGPTQFHLKESQKISIVEVDTGE